MELVIGYLSLKTQIGDMWLAATPTGLFRVEFGPVDTEAVKGFFEGRSDVRFTRGGETVEQAGRQLLHYLEGKLKRFSVRLDLTGASGFSKKVWNATRKIPYGQVKTYGWIAGRIGDPYSARAVGGALGKNPVPIFIPCHRVVGSHGWLGGFSGGLQIKERLLAIESGQSSLGFGTLTGENV